MELNLATDVKNNKKGFCKYISDKRRTRETMGSTRLGTWLHRMWKRLRY